MHVLRLVSTSLRSAYHASTASLIASRANGRLSSLAIHARIACQFGNDEVAPAMHLNNAERDRSGEVDLDLMVVDERTYVFAASFWIFTKHGCGMISDTCRLDITGARQLLRDQPTEERLVGFRSFPIDRFENIIEIDWRAVDFLTEEVPPCGSSGFLDTTFKIIASIAKGFEKRVAPLSNPDLFLAM